MCFLLFYCTHTECQDPRFLLLLRNGLHLHLLQFLFCFFNWLLFNIRFKLLVAHPNQTAAFRLFPVIHGGTFTKYKLSGELWIVSLQWGHHLNLFSLSNVNHQWTHVHVINSHDWFRDFSSDFRQSFTAPVPSLQSMLMDEIYK